MNRLSGIASQLSTAGTADASDLSSAGIRIVTVPLLLNLSARTVLMAAIEAADKDPSVTFIVFIGSPAAASAVPGCFCHGADESEFASPDIVVPIGTRGKHIKRAKDIPRPEAFFASPTVSEVVEAVDACTKVTVAAISGQCLAEGIELALACDYRIATRTATFSMDQIKTLGLIPCAGGTQRLPRAIGIIPAVHLITFGKTISAADAHRKHLIDHIIVPTRQFPLTATAPLLARAAVAQLSTSSEPSSSFASPAKIAKRRLSQSMGRIPTAIVANIQEAICRRDIHASFPRGFDAPHSALKAVMGYSCRSFSTGLRHERAEFEEVYDSAQSLAMRHLSIAKRKAAQGPASCTLAPTGVTAGGAGTLTAQCPSAASAPFGSIAIIGGGIMGSGIAACFLAAGVKTIVVDTNPAALHKCHTWITSIFKAQVDKKRLSQKSLEERMALLTTIGGDQYAEALRDVDAVIEAVYEDATLKQDIFKRLDQYCKPSCIIASNTATVDINLLAAVTSRPSQVVGIHFFAPAHIMQLAEIVKGAATSDETVLRLLSLTKRINKIGVVVGNSFGFVSNRLAIKGVFQAVCLLEEGALPYQVDGYLKQFGFPNGVFEMQDIGGLDVTAAVLAVGPPEQKMSRSVSSIPRQLLAEGRFGVRVGKGWYRYDADEPTKAKSDIHVDRACIAASDRLGINRRTISQKEALYRFLFHIVNEAALLLEQGGAVRPSDIDLIFVLGFGFPYFRGGPCYYADQVGIDNIIYKMQAFASTCGRGTFPPPCKFLVDMAKNKKRFSDFNQ